MKRVAWWRRFARRAPIRVRIVAAVVVAMSLVLVAAGAFVYWRVTYALDRQLNQDLRAYADLVAKQVAAGSRLPADDPGEVSQTFTTDGALVDESDRGLRRLLSRDQVRAATAEPRRLDLGSLLPPSEHPYRVRYFTATTPAGTVVVAAAISRRKHDEALRELLLQLGLADLATVLAAGFVGWGATRAALDPVERYRRAAAAAGGDPSRRLPVETGREDELTRLGETFNALLTEIEASHLRERQFLADASHELRSPIALMAAEIEWARHRPRSGGELEEVLSSIAGQTDRLGALANALLDLEEIASSVAEPARISVDLDQLVTSALAQPRLVASEAGREITVHVAPARVEVDRPWVELAISNLVVNALKHGRGVVTVTAEVRGATLRIQVVDEGGGVPDTLGTRAFDRFARGDHSRTSPGHGLGLALVQAVAERHGGRATIVPGGIRLEIERQDPGHADR